MPIPIRDLLRMPKGTRELYPLAEGESASDFQRKAAANGRKKGVMKFETCLVVNPKKKTVVDGVWIEVLNPLEKKR